MKTWADFFIDALEFLDLDEESARKFADMKYNEYMKNLIDKKPEVKNNTFLRYRDNEKELDNEIE